jgi:hypothetical protein
LEQVHAPAAHSQLPALHSLQQLADFFILVLCALAADIPARETIDNNAIAMILICFFILFV